MPQLHHHAELDRRLLRWTGSSAVPRYPFFEGPIIQPSSSSSSSSLSNSSGSLEDLRRWFNDIELAGSDCRVAKEQYAEVGIYFLKGDLKEVMKERREVYLKETRRGWWDWEDFKEDLKRIVEEAMKITPNAMTDVLEQMHPYIASSVKLGLVIGGTVVLLPALRLAWKRIGSSSPSAVTPCM